MSLMDPQIKTLWLNALRSDAYPQVHGRLHNSRGFCALGVLCDLHRKATKADYWRGPDGNGDFAYLEAFHYLPALVRDWAGLQGPVDLLDLDRQRLSFRETIDQIEAHL